MNRKRTKIAIVLALTFVFALLSGFSYEPVNAATKVSTPKIKVSAISDSTGIKVTIKKTKNAEGYTIYLKGPQDEEFAAVTTLEKNGKAKRTYSIKNLPGGEYNVKVKAYLKSGKKTVWSKESKVSKITIKGKSSPAGKNLPADVKEYVEKNYPELLSLYDQGLVNFSAEYETKDYITFGSFDMEYYNEDGDYGSDGKKEDMVWEVLEYSPDKKTALVISKYIIKVIRHSSEAKHNKKTVTWENSPIRTWLNDDFYNNAFSIDEKALINKVTVDNSSMSKGGNDTEDYVFLLSPSEAVKYYPDENEEGYSAARSSYLYNGRKENWALRSPAPGNAYCLQYVGYSGEMEEGTASMGYDMGIRPVCRITLTDDIIEKNNLSIGKNYHKVFKNVYVTIGSYEEDGNKEALEWQILEYDGNDGRALLISKNILGEYRFNEDGSLKEWYACTLRKFLNSTFIRETFNDEERSLILKTSLENETKTTEDSVFVLSFDEYEKFSVGKNMVSSYKNGEFGCWWVRDIDFDFECSFGYSSSCDDWILDQDDDNVGIRPVMNINLKYDKTAHSDRLDTPLFDVEPVKQEKKIVMSIYKTPNSEGYYIYMKKDSDKEFSLVADVKQDKSGSVEYVISDLEAGTYAFRVTAYKKSGDDTIKSEYTEDEVILEKPDGIRPYITGTGSVDATGYVKENYPALYELYKDGKIGLTGEGKRDTIVLGSYELEYGVESGKKYPKTEKMPLEWEVLEYSADGTKALVISKYIICHRVFDKSKLTWEESSLRKWLNSNFYKKAFSEKEQAVIILSNIKHEDEFLKGNDTSDRIFILSKNDAIKYFSDDYDRIGYFYDGVIEGWWLREDNRSKDAYSDWDQEDWEENYNSDDHPAVTNDGQLRSNDAEIDMDFIGVRPSFWITLTDEIVKANDLSILKNTDPSVEKAYVVLGSTGSEKTPLEWEILDYDENNKKALLITRYVVDELQYNSSTKKNSWADSSLRKYLNEDFINKSFSESERKLISQVTLNNETMQGTKQKDTKDKVYILSYAEYMKYFPIPYYEEKKTGSYTYFYNWININKEKQDRNIWLRSYDEENNVIMDAGIYGNMYYGEQADETYGVRPVLWLKLN